MARIRELEAKEGPLPEWEAKLLETCRRWLVEYPPEDFVHGAYIGTRK
jgi:hypothetical protein